MSLVRTLAKVAIGVAAAKGVQHAMKGRAPDGVHRGPRGGELGGLGGLVAGRGAPQGSPLADALSGLGRGGTGGAGGGLGALLSSLGGQMGAPGGSATQRNPGTGTPYGSQPASGGAMGAGSGMGGGMAGGLGAMLGPLLSGQGSKGGLGALLGGGAAAGGLGALLNQALQGGGAEPERAPTQDEEDAARILLSAMIQAAKADGRIDEGERARLMDVLGDVDGEERAFVEAEMQRPVDARGLASRTPRGMERQVYTAAALTIDPDTEEERRFLSDLREALDLPEPAAREAETSFEQAF